MLLDETQKDNLYVLLKERENCFEALEVADLLIVEYEGHIEHYKRLNLLMGFEAMTYKKRSKSRIVRVAVISFVVGGIIGAVGAR